MAVGTGAEAIGQREPRQPASGLARSLWAVAVWTLLVGLSMGVNVHEGSADARNHALLVANAYIDKDLAFKAWISDRGGVYVRPSARTPPNPWLRQPERDVTTTRGEALTLVTPTYATRQLMEDFAAQSGIRGHLTSLRPKNPDNAPDGWEESALKRLASGDRDVAEVVERDGAPVLRVMRPLFMERDCLACHTDMAIPVGALRGGIAAAVPVAPFLAAQQDAVQKLAATHGLIWLVGVGTLGLVHLHNRDRRRERLQATALRRREERRILGVLDLSERIESLDEREIIQQGLELAVQLTDSAVGYLHFVNEDQNSIELVAWSQKTLEACTAVYDTHYPIERAGIWADCARRREPVIHNDYAGAEGRRGLPPGHAELHRHMSVPVIESAAVRLITGVGNKVAPYDEADVRLIQLLANDIWKLVQRKRASTELRERERLLREAQEVARMGSWSLDHPAGELAWSDGMYAIFEVDPRLFRPSRDAMVDLVHPDDRQREAARFEAAVSGHRDYEALLRLRPTDGRSRFIRMRGQTQYTPDGKPLRTVGTAHDVTEHRELELLRRSEANLSALFENTDRVIWSVDAQARLVISNNLFDQMVEAQTGRRPQAGEIMPPRELPAADRAAWHERYARALAGETFSTETQMPAASGERWIAFTFYPIEADNGRIVGVTVFGQDFTERRRAEQQRQETLEKMQRMMGELETHHRKSMQINRLNDLLQSCRDEAEAREVLRLSLAEIFAEDGRGCVSLASPHSSEMARVACWGGGSEVAANFLLEDCWALRRGEPYEVRDGEGLVCSHFDQRPPHGYLCLPLIVKGETLGVLHLAFGPDQDPVALGELRALAQAVAETIKLSLSNLRLREALHEQATHDALTGLFNRRYLDETLPRELHRSHRAGGRLTVAMLDIDHFKHFNDTMGHEAGDTVLREIGRILRDNLRRSDIGCRYGGEELVLIMPDSSAEDASARIARMCEPIRAMRVEFRGQVLPPLTMSAGIAEAFRHGDDAETLLRSADAALYAAKAAGRDRVVVFGPQISAL